MKKTILTAAMVAAMGTASAGDWILGAKGELGFYQQNFINETGYGIEGYIGKYIGQSCFAWKISYDHTKTKFIGDTSVTHRGIFLGLEYQVFSAGYLRTFVDAGVGVGQQIVDEWSSWKAGLSWYAGAGMKYPLLGWSSQCLDGVLQLRYSTVDLRQDFISPDKISILAGVEYSF